MIKSGGGLNGIKYLWKNKVDRKNKIKELDVVLSNGDLICIIFRRGI
tara:strand:- start:203 stop:343 length:141 start_codon:yes stop_codon:yes gene_type:complete